MRQADPRRRTAPCSANLPLLGLLRGVKAEMKALQPSPLHQRVVQKLLPHKGLGCQEWVLNWMIPWCLSTTGG